MPVRTTKTDEGDDEPMESHVFTESTCFISRYTIKPGMKETFMSRFNPLWRSSIDFMNQNSNFVYYGFGRDPNIMVAVESYKDEAAVTGLRKLDGFKTAVISLLECCESAMTMELFTGIDMTTSDYFEVYPAGPSQVHPSAGNIGVQYL